MAPIIYEIDYFLFLILSPIFVFYSLPLLHKKLLTLRPKKERTTTPHKVRTRNRLKNFMHMHKYLSVSCDGIGFNVAIAAYLHPNETQFPAYRKRP